MSSYIIDDGFTATKKIEAVPGMHGEASVSYRPLDVPGKYNYLKTLSQSTDNGLRADLELVRKQVKQFNGGPLPEPLEKMWPSLFSRIKDLILSYESPDEVADLKNSSAG